MHKPRCIWITVIKFCTNPSYHLADFVYLQNVVKKFSYEQHNLIVSCCALTVFCVNVQHFLLMVSVGTSSLRRNKLIFIDRIVKIHAWITGTRYCGTSFASHLFNIWLHISTRQRPGSPYSQDWLHCCELKCRTSSGHSTGHQTARISIRLTTWFGAFCKSEYCSCPWCRPFKRMIGSRLVPLWSAYSW